jgi:hypothetical protein
VTLGITAVGRGHARHAPTAILQVFARSQRWPARLQCDVHAAASSGSSASVRRMPHRRSALSVLLAAAVVACGASSDERAPTRADVAAAKHTARAPRAFARSSVWHEPLAPDARLDPRSRVWVANLRGQVSRYGPWINTWSYSVPVYVVGRGQPSRRVVVRDAGAFGAARLQRALESVPIPDDARPAAGTDRQLTVWQPSTDRLWDFIGAERRGGRWSTRWGGAMRDVSRNPGVFWAPGVSESPRAWGATATGLPLLAGLIRADELRRGRIDHPLAMAIPETMAGWWADPARRTDGHVRDRNAIPEGARFRLDPRVSVERLRLTRVGRIIARAAQRYGMIVRDKAGAVTLYAEDPHPLGANPYPALFGRRDAAQALAGFPWNRLQALNTTLRTYASASP